MSQPGAAPGVLAAVGPAKYADLRAFAEAGLRLIRLRAHVNPVGDVRRWRDAGASDFLLQLLSPYPARRPVSPQAFVDDFSDDIEAFLGTGVCNLEVHGEPNRAGRGAGVSWQDGVAFGQWFEEVNDVLRRRFGDDLRVGFPALAPSDGPHPDSIAPLAEPIFLDQCQSALVSADWAALHVTWRTPEELRDREGGMQFLSAYLERFPEQVFYVTAFANVATDLVPQDRGQQYAEFFTLMAQYDRVVGVVGYPLRSADPGHAPLAWLAVDGTSTAVLDGIASRARLPDPERLSLSWPTETRRYCQIFGKDQQGYHRRYRIAGGHNGVDLALAASGSMSAPVTAALDGTVTQVALDEEGYGYHIRVRSYGPDRETISLLYAHLSTVEVSVGMLVFRGETLGWVDAVTEGTKPHLHLGMKVAGVRLPEVYDAVNPLPYLEVAPRG